MSISTNGLSIDQLFYETQGTKIIENFSLQLNPQKIYTVIGPSGVGKSTFLQLLAGLVTPTAGKISSGKDLYDPRQQVIGFVPQEYGLLPWQTVHQAVSKANKLTNKKVDNSLIDELLTEMQLTEHKNQYPHQLSGGQKQRVAIARAFASQSELLLMDEPFSALDAFTKEKAQNLFVELWHKNPVLTIFVTHDVEEALLLGHEILIFDYPGKIKEQIASPFQEKQDLAHLRQQPELYQWLPRLKEALSR